MSQLSQEGIIYASNGLKLEWCFLSDNYFIYFFAITCRCPETNRTQWRTKA